MVALVTGTFLSDMGGGGAPSRMHEAVPPHVNKWFAKDDCTTISPACLPSIIRVQDAFSTATCSVLVLAAACQCFQLLAQPSELDCQLHHTYINIVDGFAVRPTVASHGLEALQLGAPGPDLLQYWFTFTVTHTPDAAGKLFWKSVRLSKSLENLSPLVLCA
jgi:hypothetical protein